MSTTLMFCVPAHGRLRLAEACLRQLARTCDELSQNGIEASAVVVADDDNLEVARELGFGTVERDNDWLGRKWNDAYQLAGICGADFVVPFGTDDWVDAKLLLDAPLDPNTVTCFRRAAFVREDGERLAPLRIPYDTGVGIRAIPANLMQACEWRPAEDDAPRAIDASVWRGLARGLGRRPDVVYHDLHAFQIVDFKSADVQLNSYADCLRYLDGDESDDPFGALELVYPAEAVGEMRGVYGLAVAA